MQNSMRSNCSRRSLLQADHPPVVRCQLSVVSCPRSGNADGRHRFRGESVKTNFENLRIYQLSETVADQIWDIVFDWDEFARGTIGRQLVRSADSIGANIAEGSGRGSFQDNRRFVRIARGSLNETKHWLRRAYKHKLLTTTQVGELKPVLDELAPKLNAYLRSIGPARSNTRYDRPTDDGQRTTDNGPRTND
jgi:four helix bundle protein